MTEQLFCGVPNPVVEIRLPGHKDQLGQLHLGEAASQLRHKVRSERLGIATQRIS